MIVLFIITVVLLIVLYGGNSLLIDQKVPEFNFFPNRDDELKKPKRILPDPENLKCLIDRDSYDYYGKMYKAGTMINCKNCNNHYFKKKNNTCVPFMYDKVYNEIGCGGISDVREPCPIDEKYVPERGVCTLDDVEPKKCPSKKYFLF